MSHGAAVDRSDRRRAEIILLGVVAAWGLTFPAIKVAVTDVTPALFMALRFGLVLVGLAAIGRGRYSKNLKVGWRSGLILGLLLWASYLFQALGLAHTTATRSAFITGLSVVIVPLVYIPLRRRMPGWRVVVGIALSVVGLFLMTRPDVGRLNLGDILTFGTAISYALYIVILELRSHVDRLDALIGWQALVMAVASILAVPILDGVTGTGGGMAGHGSITGILTALQHTSLPTAASLAGPNLMIGLLVTVPVAIVSILAITRFQRRTTAIRAGVLYSAEPLFAALFAAL
ncbi:MAG: drug/metabolite transporter (DMT) superfamily permease, partial [bacterium]